MSLRRTHQGCACERCKEVVAGMVAEQLRTLPRAWRAAVVAEAMAQANGAGR